MPRPSPLLHVDQLTCTRNDKPLFEPVNLRLYPGDVLLITGPNGVGKTSLLKKIAQQHPEPALYVGHKTGIKQQLTVEENLRWQPYQAIAPTSEAIEQALRYFDLTAARKKILGLLSAGQQRKVALTCLRLQQAALWLLDEPFTCLDQSSIAQLKQLITAHAHEGGVTILTSHQACDLPTLSVCRLAL